MKTIFFIIVPIFLLLLGNLTGMAQTVYEFGYDAAGNRTSRSVILLKSANIPADSLMAKQSEKPFEDLIGERQIKIYPNPTKGLLRVEVPLDDEAQATLEVYTARGALLRKLRVVDELTEINLSSQPSGMYVLRILVGAQSSEWKIIKD